MTKLIAFTNDLKGIRTENHRVRGQKTVHTSYVALSVSAFVTCAQIKKNHKMEYYQGHLSLYLSPPGLASGHTKRYANN